MISVCKGDLSLHCLACGKSSKDDPINNKPYIISIGSEKHEVELTVCFECLEKLSYKITAQKFQ